MNDFRQCDKRVRIKFLTDLYTNRLHLHSKQGAHAFIHVFEQHFIYIYTKQICCLFTCPDFIFHFYVTRRWDICNAFS